MPSASSADRTAATWIRMSTQYRSSSSIFWIPATCPAIRLSRALSLFRLTFANERPQSRPRGQYSGGVSPMLSPLYRPGVYFVKFGTATRNNRSIMQRPGDHLVRFRLAGLQRVEWRSGRRSARAFRRSRRGDVRPSGAWRTAIRRVKMVRTYWPFAALSAGIAIAGFTFDSTSSARPQRTAQAPPQAKPHDYDHWEKEIAAYEAADRANPPARGGILFIGSSTIRMWNSLAQDFPGRNVINRGFGGSELADSTHFIPRDRKST